MRRRFARISHVWGYAFIVMLSVALCPFEIYAQRPTRSYQIGYLITGPQLAWANRIEALRAGLRDLGYIEGKNLTIIFRSGATAEHLPEPAAELVRLKVDVIFATASTEVEAVRHVRRRSP